MERKSLCIKNLELGLTQRPQERDVAEKWISKDGSQKNLFNILQKHK